MSRQKRKGDGYERELAHWLNTNVYKEERCERAPLSGGGSVNMAAGGADLLGTPGIFVEAKRVEKLPWRDALAQAERNSALLSAQELQAQRVLPKEHPPDHLQSHIQNHRGAYYEGLHHSCHSGYPRCFYVGQCSPQTGIQSNLVSSTGVLSCPVAQVQLNLLS